VSAPGKKGITIDADTLSRWLETARRGSLFVDDGDVAADLDALEQEIRQAYLDALRAEASP
jgi:hypothetical protein